MCKSKMISIGRRPMTSSPFDKPFKFPDIKQGDFKGVFLTLFNQYGRPFFPVDFGQVGCVDDYWTANSEEPSRWQHCFNQSKVLSNQFFLGTIVMQFSVIPVGL